MNGIPAVEAKLSLNISSHSADVLRMLTLFLLLAMQVVIPGELSCVGSIREEAISADVYVAGVDNEGTTTLASPGQILYLNGPHLTDLKPGTVHKVVRLEGTIDDPSTHVVLGTYFKDIGKIRIEKVGKGNAVARVLSACQGIIKGDLVIPYIEKPAIEFKGDLSNSLTPIGTGLTGSILLGKDDSRMIGQGQFCFIGLGSRDGVKLGDRFTIYRPHPEFNPNDMSSGGAGAFLTYSSRERNGYQEKMTTALRSRALPPIILGDIVVVEVGAGASTAKVINSLSEISPGDMVVRK